MDSVIYHLDQNRTVANADEIKDKPIDWAYFPLENRYAHRITAGIANTYNSGELMYALYVAM